MTRPSLNRNLSAKTFSDYYYLKEELVQFCKANAIACSGKKEELTERVKHFLETGQKQSPKKSAKKKQSPKQIQKNSIIEPDIICSEIHRDFFRHEIGPSFAFYVDFQNWLKNNAGETYENAVAAWYRIKSEKQNNKGQTKIDKQFEYNTYIRDFFKDNPGKSLNDAIQAWNYKKALPGHNRYEKKDLK